ncbi:MAG: ATP-dependent DNA helicase RecG [Proteobacteria bacterium]|nr:ATP-dependent DNA helicase RecG [Pseudomonadota bacterium]
MPASLFQAALEAVARPLDFAADENPGSGHLRDFEDTVRGAAERAGGLAIPRDVRAALRRVAETFARPREGADRAAAVRRALAALARFRDPAFPDEALARSVVVLPGIGPRRADQLERRGLGRVSDLLFHLPVRYDDRRQLTQVGDLEVGLHATFIAEVLVADFLTSGRPRGGRYRRIFQAVVGDETGKVNLKWFRGGEALAALLTKGTRVLVTGDVKRYRFDKELVHPEVERIDAATGEGAALGTLRQIVPDYVTPEGLNPRTFRGMIDRAVEEYADLVAGFLPQAVVRARDLPEPAEALHVVHTPPPDADVDAYRAQASPAHERLVLEELFLLEAGLALRHAARATLPGIAIDVETGQARRAAQTLPFSLTDAQHRSWGEIRADLARPHPMNRLLQGDVGSGKTAVAYLAAVAVAASGRQTALMAPTELLAEQHARTLSRLAESVDPAERVRVALLTSSVARPEADAVRRALADGDVDLVVGTHALVQGDVRFARLALAITDEQHRFGVIQRQALAAKCTGDRHPHALVMTATPIPRTLALTLYGDLDLSVIDELPPGRAPTRTLLLRTGEGRQVVRLIREATSRGEQVYVVYPLVEESEKIDLRSATESAERIRGAFPDLNVDLVHGRLESAERGAAMARFERGETHILVATSVVEVGVDMPGATLMVIEHAERFGLAQLHQLRGRVGRGDRPGTCVLVARGGSEDGEARLRAMLDTTDGFRIADADLRIRGPGEFLGTRQHGHLPDLRVADLLRDARLVSVAREAALEAVRRDPGLGRAPETRRAVELRWGDRLALAGVG